MNKNNLTKEELLFESRSTGIYKNKLYWRGLCFAESDKSFDSNITAENYMNAFKKALKIFCEINNN